MVEFYTASSSKRPIRLCEQTRAFAMESLQGRYGDEAMRHPFVSLDDIPAFDALSPQQRYNKAILRIAETAPLRICEAETVSGAATLGEAIHHVVPAFFDGLAVCSGVSHLTVNFQVVLFEGVDALEKQIDSRLSGTLTAAQKDELCGMKTVIAAMHIYHERYCRALKEQRKETYALLQSVPFRPASSFREAVQSLWFTFSFLRLCGNWPGIGRIDEMLGGFLKADLENGRITLDEAREFLAGFFIKGCEWIQSNTPVGTGDAQHYQNIVLGGIDKNGSEVTNDVTYLVLDIVEELAISDFPITVRINTQTPDRLLTRIAQVMRHGGGIVAVYNEPLILRSLEAFGYDPIEARSFANDGCWEIQIPGKTHFAYRPFDGLQILLHDTLRSDTPHPAHFDSFEELYAAFHKNLTEKVRAVYDGMRTELFENDPNDPWKWTSAHPCSAISLFETGCIESGRSYLRGGPIYTVISPHIGGAPDVGNSLFAIDRLVFQDKLLSFDELMHHLQTDWEQAPTLRSYVSSKYVYYGNDNDEADAYTVRVCNDFADIVASFDDVQCPVRFPAGISTFGRQIDWLPMRSAVPFGRKKGEILSGNASPTPNTDFEGATAVIRSYCKTDLVRQTCGAALDVKLHPSAVAGDNGITALKALIGGFITLGGFFMQLDVMDAAVLEQARQHPEDYKTLSVRVSGWNARFVTLSENWQKMIIERTAQQV